MLVLLQHLLLVFLSGLVYHPCHPTPCVCKRTTHVTLRLACANSVTASANFENNKEEDRLLEIAMQQSMAQLENDNLRQMTDEELQAVVPGASPLQHSIPLLSLARALSLFPSRCASRRSVPSTSRPSRPFRVCRVPLAYRFLCA